MTLRSFLLARPRLFLALFAPDDRELGLLGEEAAARHLADKGWRILARRLRTRAGEADLVARRGDVLSVVEVKSGRLPALPRPAGRPLPPAAAMRWRPGHRVDARRLARLRATARELARRTAGGVRARVDLVEVLVAPDGRGLSILHHEDLRAPLP